MQADVPAVRNALRPDAGARCCFRVRLHSPRLFAAPLSVASYLGVEIDDSRRRGCQELHGDDVRAFARRSDQGRAQPDKATHRRRAEAARVGQDHAAAAAQGIRRGHRAARRRKLPRVCRWPWRRRHSARCSSLRPLPAGSSFRPSSASGRWRRPHAGWATSRYAAAAPGRRRTQRHAAAAAGRSRTERHAAAASGRRTNRSRRLRSVSN